MTDGNIGNEELRERFKNDGALTQRLALEEAARISQRAREFSAKLHQAVSEKNFETVDDIRKNYPDEVEQYLSSVDLDGNILDDVSNTQDGKLQLDANGRPILSNRTHSQPTNPSVEQKSQSHDL